MYVAGKITRILRIATTHDIIPQPTHEILMPIAQKRLVRVTLDIMCYDDLDVEDIDWKDLLDLEGGEEVYSTVKEIDPF